MSVQIFVENILHIFGKSSPRSIHIVHKVSNYSSCNIVRLDPTHFSLKGTKKVYKSLINQTFDVLAWSVNVNLLLIMEIMKV